MTRRIVTCAAVALTALLTIATHPEAGLARSAQDALAGKVALSRRALPGKKGQPSYLRALRKHAHGRAVFWQNPKDGSWQIHYAVVLRRPPRSGQLTLALFDVSHGKQFIGTREKMMFGDSHIASGTLTLSRRDVFDPNARLLMVVSADGRELVGQRIFYIQGKPETFSGQVSFAADDTAPASASDDAGRTPHHRRH